jgi:uncharacterized repeat protein (TIGR01451 family)
MMAMQAGRRRTRSLVAAAVLLTALVTVVAIKWSASPPRHLTVHEPTERALRNAIRDAASGATIRLPAGTIRLTSQLDVDKSLTLEGAGAGRTLLSGGHTTRVLRVSGERTKVTLESLAIADGAIRRPREEAQGAGLKIEDATVALAHVRVVGNTLDVNGTAGRNGGFASGAGIYMDRESVISLDDTRVTGNSILARGGPGAAAGYARGAGLAALGSRSVTIRRSSIDHNSVDASSAGPRHGGFAMGGGIYNSGTRLEIIRSTISENRTEASGRRSSASGGGMMVLGPVAMLLENATIARNVARSAGTEDDAYGGGAVLDTGYIRNSTIVGNAAIGDSGLGGNLFQDGRVRLVNSIVADGVGVKGYENCVHEPTVSLGHNIESGDDCRFHAATDRTNTDPRLRAVAGDRGPGETFAPAIHSPAVDSADAAQCPRVDELGTPRPRGAACDAGAVELSYGDVQIAPRSSSAHIPVGGGIRFRFSVTSTGNDTAHHVTLTVRLPSGLALQTGPDCVRAGDTVTCQLGNLVPGTGKTVTVAMGSASDPGIHTATATLHFSATDPTPANDSARASVVVTPASAGGSSTPRQQPA